MILKKAGVSSYDFNNLLFYNEVVFLIISGCYGRCKFISTQDFYGFNWAFSQKI
jgi:hypothetical protein